MLQFDQSFFQEEVREGFCIKPMMKRVWAAQMEVLARFDDVCRNNGIRYFADWGTLLGAVRHKGFVQWDDDMDIVMLRDDYQKFYKIASEQLPEGYDVANVHAYDDYQNAVVRVINSRVVSCEPERLREYHGCPYVVGIDIDILDYKSRNPEEDNLQLELLKIVLQSDDAVNGYEKGEITFEELRAFLSQLEGLCSYTFNYGKSLHQQIRVLGDYICMLYKDEDADEVQGPIYRIHHRSNYSMPKEWFSEAVYMPFEDIMELPVPKGYDSFLRLKYGDDYMTPTGQTTSHEYPFYSFQEKILAEFLIKNQLPGEPFDIDLKQYKDAIEL